MSPQACTDVIVKIMTRYNGLILFACFALLLCSCKRDDLTGNEYYGNYHSLERISLYFKPGGRVTGHFNSVEVVGWFSDNSYGRYEYDYPKVTLSWSRVPLDNYVYKQCPANPDSIVVSSSFEYLTLYEGGEKYHLKRHTIPISERILWNTLSFLVKYSILIIPFILAFILALIIRFVKWLRETRN